MEKVLAFQELMEAITEGDEDKTQELVLSALDGGVDPLDIINKGLVPAIEHVGELFNSHVYFIPEMICSASAMKRGLALAREHMKDSPEVRHEKFVIGTVKGDCHDIGKNLTVAMLQAGGFEVIDLGCDVAPERFVDAVRESGAPFLGMSALLTTTMFFMQDTISLLKEQGLREQVQIIIGGAVVNEAFAQRIGADAYAAVATDTVRLAKSSC